MKPFVTRGRKKLATLAELHDHLQHVSDAEFEHHVHDDVNDFAAWVEHELHDKFLASAMRQATSKEGMRRAVFVAMFR
jgi:hypothetical protein